jgi:hypothetical protein
MDAKGQWPGIAEREDAEACATRRAVGRGPSCPDHRAADSRREVVLGVVEWQMRS